MPIASQVAAALASRLARPLAAALLCAGANGCASLKHMTADFEKKWDDPKSILAEMDMTAPGTRATDSSAEGMAAFNSGDCARKHDIMNTEGEKDMVAARRLAAGECLLAAGKNEEAARFFGLLAEEAPSAAASQGAGVALVRLGRFEEAATALEIASAADPSLWRAWNALGVARDHQGMKQEAWDAFSKAAEINPFDGAPLNNLGVSKLKAGLAEEAIAAFMQALELDGAREAAEANLRLAYAMAGDYANSVKGLPDNRRVIALNNAGVAAASRGDTTEARRLFTQALDESPHFYAKAYNNLSLLLE